MSTSSSADRDARVTTPRLRPWALAEMKQPVLCLSPSFPLPVYEERKLRVLESKDPTWFPNRYDGELRETLFRSQGSQVSMRMAMGSGSLLSSHGRGIGPQDAPKDSQGLSGDAAGNPGFPGLEPVTSGTFSKCL